MARCGRVRSGETSRLVLLTVYGPSAAALLAAVLPLGGVMPGWALFAAAAAALALAIHRRDEQARLPLVAIPFFALGALTLLQAVPLPVPLLRIASPHAAEIWSNALGPLGTPVTPRPVSLAPALTLVEAAKWLSYGALAWLGERLSRRRGPSPVARLALGAALLVGAITLVHGALGLGRVYGLYTPKADFPRWHVGPLLNVNHLSGYLSLGVYAALALALADRTKQPARTLGFLAAATALVTGIVLLASRGAVAALVAGTVLATAAAYRVGRDRDSGATVAQRLAFPAAVVVAGAGLAVLGYEGAIRQGLGERNFQKLVVAGDSLAMIRDNFWTGVGRGAFGSAFHAYKQRFPDAFWTHPENIAVQWLTEWGVPISLIAFFAFLYALRGARIGRSVGTAVLGTGLLALIAQNLVDYGLELPGVAALAALVLGAVARARTVRVAPWARHAAAGAIALVCLLAFAARPISDEEARRDALATATTPAGLAEALARFPADPYFSFLAGSLSARGRDAGDPSRALAWYNRALVLSPNELDVLLAAADVLARSGHAAQARLQLREAALRCPGWEVYVVAHAVPLTRTEDDLLASLPRGAKNEAAYLRAFALAVPVDAPLAELVFTRALARAPCDVEVLARRAAARVAALETPACQEAARAACADGAREDAERLEACGAAQEAELTRIELTWSEGRRDESLTRLQRACERGWGDEAACIERLAARAAVARQLDLLARVERQYASRRCVSEERCAEAWRVIAGWHLDARDPGGALIAARKAVDSSPSDLEAQRLLARTAEATGASIVAYRAYRSILARAPGDADATAGVERLEPKTVPGPPPPR